MYWRDTFLVDLPRLTPNEWYNKINPVHWQEGTANIRHQLVSTFIYSQEGEAIG
jgi:hypothetical protein